jgi:hypothetical protein
MRAKKIYEKSKPLSELYSEGGEGECNQGPEEF